MLNERDKRRKAVLGLSHNVKRPVRFVADHVVLAFTDSGAGVKDHEDAMLIYHHLHE